LEEFFPLRVRPGGELGVRGSLGVPVVEEGLHFRGADSLLEDSSKLVLLVFEEIQVLEPDDDEESCVADWVSSFVADVGAALP
jgi:hypothetical protein